MEVDLASNAIAHGDVACAKCGCEISRSQVLTGDNLIIADGGYLNSVIGRTQSSHDGDLRNFAEEFHDLCVVDLNVNVVGYALVEQIHRDEANDVTFIDGAIKSPGNPR
jgi:hypothetical protein